ncbi:MAG: TlpA family protein disulfide reductase [Lewinellaceae bacterium]|nr:TlpA family protein disulfide reductase [Lewinellaceae bacterium]
MKYFAAIAGLLFFAWPLFSQNNNLSQGNYRSDTLFPFNIPLLNIDSTQLSNSKKIMAIPKKENNRKPTVIAFWLTTCIPCHHELATYTAHYADWKKQADFNLYAISTDFPKNFRRIAGIVKEKQFPFPVFWDKNHLYRTVMPGGLNGLPQVFIFDKNGKLAYQHKGFRTGDEAALFAKIIELQ